MAFHAPHPDQRGVDCPLHHARPTPARQRQSARTPVRFGLLPVRSPLLGESSLFLAVLRCFTSRGSLPAKLGDGPCAHRVAPFGLPRISGRQRLPWAFRRVAASFLGRHRQGIHPAPVFRTSHNAPVPYTLSRPSSLTSETPDRLAPVPGRTHHCHAPTMALPGEVSLFRFCPRQDRTLASISLCSIISMQCAWMIRHDQIGQPHPRPQDPAGLAWRIVKVQEAEQ